MTPIDTVEVSSAAGGAPPSEIHEIHASKPANRTAQSPTAANPDPRARKQSPAKLGPAAVMVIFHLLAFAALFMFTWKGFIAFAVLWFFAINVGIGMGYHRLLTHRGYRTPKWLEYFLALCGTLSLEGGPIAWVATHRIHHQLTDRPGDPHTPHDGGWWSHAGWIMSGASLHRQTALLGRYAPDLAKDRVHVLLSKYHYVPLTAVGLALLAWGGWSCVLSGYFSSRHPWPSLHLACEFRYPHVGLQALSYPRRFAQ